MATAKQIEKVVVLTTEAILHLGFASFHEGQGAYSAAARYLKEVKGEVNKLCKLGKTKPSKWYNSLISRQIADLKKRKQPLRAEMEAHVLQTQKCAIKALI